MKQRNFTQDILKKLTNEEIENIVKEINKEQMQYIGEIAIFHLLSDSIKYNRLYKENSGILDNSDKEKSEIETINNKIFNSIKNIEVIMYSDKHKGELGLEYFKGLRKNVYKLLKSISNYTTEISYGNEISIELINRARVRDDITIIKQDIDFNRLYTNITSFLMEDTNLLKAKVMDLIGVIPFRITKQSYYDMFKKNIVKSLANRNKLQVDYILKRYRAIFNSSLEEEYGHRFENYFRISQESKLFDFQNKDIRDIERFQENTTKTLVDMEKILKVIRKIGVILNKLIVISLISEEVTNKLLNNNTKSVFQKWNVYKEDEDESLGNEIITLCERRTVEVEKRFGDNNAQLQKISLETLVRKNVIGDDLSKELLKTQLALAYLNDNTIEKENLIIQENAEVVDRDYLEQSVNNLIEFMDRGIKNMSSLQRKARMRKILSLTDFPFETPEEFFSYLSNSIELSSSKEEVLVAIDNIAKVVSIYNQNKNINGTIK